MRTAGILATTALSLAALGGHARADTARAWAAAKAALPADARLVIGIDVAAVQKTQLFQTFYAKLHDSTDVNEILGAMKDGCKLEPLSVIRGLVVATSDDQKEGAAYVALAGADRARLSSCFQRVAQIGRKDVKIAVKQSGDITELTMGSDTSVVGWIGKDVLVVPKRGQDKASLVKWMGGKGAFAKSDLARTLAKVNTGAAIWGASDSTTELQPGMNLKGGYGTAALAGGSVAIDFHAVMDSAEQATAAAGMANLITAKQAMQAPPEIAPLLKAISIAADKDEIRIKANVDEKDLLAAIQHGLVGMGGP